MKKLLAGLAVTGFMSLIIVAPVMAIELPGLNTTAKTAGIDQNPSDPTTLASNLVSQVLSFVGVLFLILMIYGGFMWMTAAGNDERVKTARKVVVSGVIGLIIILSAYAITKFIGTELLGS